MNTSVINELLPHELEKYIAEHTTKENEVLHALDRETNLKVLMPNMISGQVQGVFLRMVSHMVRPKNVLEIGTYTGYSGICLAAGMQKEGFLYTIDKNEELEEMALKYFEKSGFGSQVKMMVGNAMEIVSTLQETFDLVFIDADKVNYENYYNLVFDKVSKGGYIVADNVLWKGKVSDSNQTDKETEALRTFNKMVQDDERVENIILSVRDGLTLIRKLV
ncbi:MAG: caffeoyl-CoA O-methyltransferase [Arenicella sp.]|jgi:caffeoyl-CoA O-methyltransferase